MFPEDKYIVTPEGEVVPFITKLQVEPLFGPVRFTTVYRNFGWSEYRALRASGSNFQIGSNFGSKQFWLNKQGLNWWKSTKFSKNFTAKIIVNNNALRHGYKFLDAGKYEVISFDSQKALDVFNKNSIIEWIQYQ